MQLSRILKAPLWIAALASGAKSFVGNPIIGSRRLNAAGLHVGRVRLADCMARWRRRWLGRALSRQDREAFARDGFILKPNFLPQAVFERLHGEVLRNDWDVREMRQGPAATRRVPLDRACLRQTRPALAALVGDRALAALIRYVAADGGEPVYSLQAVIADAAGSGHDPQTDLHSDTFQPTAKAWLFLQEVGPADGPFRYVPGSHLRTPARLAWEKAQSLSAAGHPLAYHARGSFRVGPDDLDRMGLPRARSVTVKANTLVVADTSGFHARTASERPTCRVEIYASLRRNPFLPWVGLDPLSLPYLRDRSGSASIRWLEALSRLGLGKMPWRPIGRMRLDARAGAVGGPVPRSAEGGAAED